MQNRHICPKCKKAGEAVAKTTVDHQLQTAMQEEDWHICMSPDCEIAYYSQKNIIETKDIKDQLWYKNPDENVYICYCFKISRKDIYNAVQNGAKTIEDIYKYKGIKYKNNCNCEANNPTGKCCYYVFTEEINKNLKELNNND